VSTVRRACAALAVACAAIGAAHPARAEGGAAIGAYDDIAPARAVDLHAFFDLYALANLDDPQSGLNQLRQFDLESNAVRLGYVRLTLAHAPGAVGFRVDAGAGAVADVYERQDPASVRHPDVARATSFIGQAYVTVAVPLARTVYVDAGKFATPVGLEDNESLENWAYSRSLLYSWAEPSLHTGLRLSSQVARTLALSLFWVNGWNSVVLDGNQMRSFAAAATLRPTGRLEAALVYMGGLEHPPSALAGPLSFRNVVDAYATLTAWERARFAVTADVGHDAAAGGVHWWGVGGSLRVEGPPWLAGALRGEVLADPSGFLTGTPERVAEVTATAEVRLGDDRARWLGRFEYRHDRSTATVFDAAAPASRRSQDTLTFALLVAL
jgi:hypothetical protein